MAAIPQISTVGEFLAHALALEREAGERYRELADLMDAESNARVAEFFRRMAALEDEHHGRLGERCAGHAPAAIEPWDYRWRDPEGPGAPGELVERPMTAHHALAIALANEQRALDFFREVAATAQPPEVRALAAEFAAEEVAHVDFVLARIARENDPARGT